LATYYLETSALAKLYISEPGTVELVELATRADEPRLVVSSLSRVELRSAVQRRLRAGDLSSKEAEDLFSSFHGHWQGLFVVQPVTEAVLDRALMLIDAHGLRAYDSVQLAGCLAHVSRSEDPPTFVCSDRALLKAARSEGLDVFDPAR
jgi:predicted nucleic acid-binding protein